jgi:predicted nucleic-acid-binding Zn-ribbon protein
MATKAQIEETIKKHLNTVGFKPQCSMCGQSNWSIGDIIAPSVLAEDGKTVRHDNSIPSVVIVCINCGYVVQFSAAKLGLVVPA